MDLFATSTTVAQVLQNPEAEATDVFAVMTGGNYRLTLSSYSVVSHCSSFGEGPLPERDISVDNPVLADTAMVSQADGDAKRFSSISPRPSPVPGGHTVSEL